MENSFEPSPGFWSTTGTWKLVNVRSNGVDDWAIGIWLDSEPHWPEGVGTVLELSAYGREYIVYLYLRGGDAPAVMDSKRVQ